MSQSTYLYTHLTFCGKTYNNLREVEDDLTKLDEQQKRIKNRLMTLAMMTEPSKFNDSDMSNADWLENEVDTLLEDLEYVQIDLYKLEILKERWNDCHDEKGLGIDPPNGFDKSFIDGDYVRTIKFPDDEKLFL